MKLLCILALVELSSISEGFSTQSFWCHNSLLRVRSSSTTNLGLAASSLKNNAVSPPVTNEVCETMGVTLARFMEEIAILNPELAEMTVMFSGIQTACKAIGDLGGDGPAILPITRDPLGVRESTLTNSIDKVESSIEICCSLLALTYIVC